MASLPKRKFYMRYAAYMALGIEPDGSTWKDLKQRVADRKLGDQHKRYVKQLEGKTGPEVMAIERAHRTGEAPPPATVSTPARPAPKPAAPAPRPAASSEPAKQEPAAAFLARVQASLNGKAA